MYNNSSVKKILLLASVVLLCSCDKDYNTIGDGLIGGENFGFDKYTSEVVAYNQKITPVQSNDLPINALGIYDDPAFGKTTANFATQVSLETLSPTIGTNPVIESVVLTIPYFVDATQTVVLADGNRTYVLDSIYGSSSAKLKLGVYESGYFMRDQDPLTGFVEKQKFFTDQNAAFDNAKVGNRLNDDIAKSQNDEFFFDAAEYRETTTVDGVTKTTATVPGMRLSLNKSFFASKILNAPAAKLSSLDVFKDYFRGLYFKVENSGTSAGNLSMLNFKAGKITIKYKEDTSTTDNTKVEKTIVLKLEGNTVSLLTQSNSNVSYENATNTANINRTSGDKKLFLKGGEGSMAILELFGPDADNNGVADELELIKNKGWLINEANLVFHIDANTMANSFEPQRIYLYDLNNNRPVIDYDYDGTSGAAKHNVKTLHGGIITKSTAANGRGLTYKIRITNQVRNLIKKDSTNVKLGLVVTEDIGIITSNYLNTSNSYISRVPKASVMNPLGTVLFGNNILTNDPDYAKRLKLEIIYTKLN
ncbi:DUF4270 domain-containing protein [Flavobacterium sp. K5-23]|uniref:DUF4270 domain-containing protein n=1 Tax=Flavobacterium sp. K5-23 TaxID=2746225 RepID=UPI00200F40C9|nr:DUF4270 domain-containing protein [Flavobacterium sp. K5-23]UQD55710.1 DUF4270 domain-containing protein [Flavobacterium sp. K5-23]